MDNARKLAVALGTTTDWLLTGREDFLSSENKSPSKPDELLERIFALMADVESLPADERARFDKTIATHHKLREVLAGKGKP